MNINLSDKAIATVSAKKQVYLTITMYHGLLTDFAVYDHKPHPDQYSECYEDGHCPECGEGLDTPYGCDSCGWGDYEWDDSTRLLGPINIITDNKGDL